MFHNAVFVCIFALIREDRLWVRQAALLWEYECSVVASNAYFALPL